jgi:microcystin degradation protein MlrC
MPIVLGGGMAVDFLAPMRQVFRHIAEIESRPGVLSANLFMVHPFNAAPDLGWSVIVTTDGDQALADRIADELADRAWAARRVPLPDMLPAAEVMRAVRDSRWRKLGAISLVDVDDAVGAGAPGGNTHLLAEAVEHDDLAVFLPLHDPDAVERLWQCQPGERVEVTLRGTPGYGDQPAVSLSATVGMRRDTDFGRTIRLDSGATRVAVTERPAYTVTPTFWRQLGLDPRSADAIVQKALFHYRIFYVACSFQHFGVTSAGASSLERVRQRDYAVPTYPGQDPTDWRDSDPLLRQLGAARPGWAEREESQPQQARPTMAAVSAA